MHRRDTEGQTWAWNERLLWALLSAVDAMRVEVGRPLGSKSKKVEDYYRPYPWSADNSARRLGDTTGMSDTQVIAVLDQFC